MANKQFGIKEFTLIGSSGSPTIQSPNNLILNANTVAISTNLTVGSVLTVNSELNVTNINASNINITNTSGVTTIGQLSVTGVSTFAGITTVTGPSLFTKQLNVSGVTTFGPGLSGNHGDIDLQHNGATRAYWDGSAGTLNFKDGNSVTFGDTNDVSMYWDGTDFYLTKNTVAGSIKFTKSTGNETIAVFSNDGPVELYYDNSKKFETASSGVNIVGTTTTGQLSVSGVSTFSGDIKTNGSNVVLGLSAGVTDDRITWNTDSAEVYADTSRLYLKSQLANGINIFGTGTIALANYAGTKTYLLATEDGSVDLYHNNSKKFETASSGVNIVGTTTTGQLSVTGFSTFYNNVSVGGTISVNGGVTLATNNATIVGTSATAGEIKRIGNAPFFYDGSAWREFVLSSGTPVTQPADTEWDNVVFRATFDDDFTDAKFGVSPVVVGAGASIVGAAYTIGTGSYRNTGGYDSSTTTGIGVSYAYRSDYDFTGSWTIEFWIYHDSAPSSYESLVSQVSTTDGSGDWTFGMWPSGGGSTINWGWHNENYSSGGIRVLYQASSTTFNSNFLDKWNHYALVREGDNGSLHFYVNGVEASPTINDAIIDNDILHINGAGLILGGGFGQAVPAIDAVNWNYAYFIDAYFDDMRISAGVGTAGQRYTSINDNINPTFTPPSTALPTSGTLTSVVNPPGDKYGEITLGGSPTWRGTSGVTVSQQSSGNYRVSFASSYTNANDYYVLSQGMDQGFASYVGIARSTTHVDFSINRQSNDAAVDTGSLGVQIKNHI